ncbi:DUF5685 family protein [Clostridium sp. SHJSY1]|uniref:DUF5685 family protein n=1 Tax=Clostridium sp. SHJSY1 TaxID=2942483 RepID=UPI0028761573|nr:DUF5685 family protein [Clostridium sp. SHJSY1]MDS0524455.1 DUF5685 family protein [Clostridium sp. SHJSY1]
MFGYVVPLKSELKIREFNQFKAYYCGLCFSIKKHFGNIPRMTLNYDMTFLSLLLDGLNPEKVKVEGRRCMSHPTNKKLIVLDNNALSYAANMNVSLVYFKLLDDVHDDKDLKSKTLALGLKPYKNKFSESITHINDIIKENLNNLSKLEESKTFTSIDEICDPFSIIVGKILELYPYDIINDSVITREKLYNLGYSLGKWIYLVDALDDLKDDMEKNKFNPINFLYNSDNLHYDEFLKTILDRLEFSILNCACTCRDILAELDLQRNREILENIINLGMMDKYTAASSGCKSKKNEHLHNNYI